MTWPRAVTVVMLPVGIAAVCLAVTAQIVSPDLGESLEVGVTTLVAALSAVLAFVVTWREPRNALGAVLAWVGLLGATTGFADTYPLAAARAGGGLPSPPDWFYSFIAFTWVWMYCALTILFLLYPTGRAVSRRWGLLVPAQLSCAALVQLVVMLRPYDNHRHSFGILSQPVSVGLLTVLFPIFVSLMLAAAWSVVLRYRRGDETLRRQIKLLVLAVPLLPLTLALSWIGKVVWGTHNLAGLGIATLLLAIPLATAVAVVKHDLFDVDRVVAGTAAYSVLTTAIVVVYVAVVTVSGAVLGETSPWVAAAVTALLAILLGPFRTRLHYRVDRVLYPQRRRAVDALGSLERRVNAGEATPESLQRVLRDALQTEDLHVGVTDPAGSGYVGVDGAPVVPNDGAFAEVQGQRVGVLIAPSLNSRLLRELADRATLLLEVIRLRQQATRALADARASRARLQEVGYEERRRLERDLHDVAQQRLVALAISMRLAQRRLSGRVSLTADETVGLIGEWVREVTVSTAELRDLAHGIRPSCLDDGLRPALTMLTQRVPVPLEATIDVRGPFSDAVSTTAYFVAAEALANALKHAAATEIDLEVCQQDDRLIVRVSDDGRGGAVVDSNHGLGSMTDRVAAAGGRLTVTTGSNGGTVVEAELPCGS